MLAHLRSCAHRQLVPLGILPILLLLSLAACGPTGMRSSGLPNTTSTPAPTSTYVAIGASDAYGIGTDDPDRESWPTVLAGLLGPHTHLINLGIPGEIVSQSLSMELPVALASQPNVITVWLAVNDLVDDIPLATYQVALRQLLVSLRDRTRARIFVGNIPDLTLLPHFFTYDPVALTSQVERWNSAIAYICAQVGVTLVDIHAAWESLIYHPDYISSDGFHPSAAGARQLAQLFYSSINTATGH
jgi:lysophospholipase L1-like esterase